MVINNNHDKQTQVLMKTHLPFWTNPPPYAPKRRYIFRLFDFSLKNLCPFTFPSTVEVQPPIRLFVSTHLLPFRLDDSRPLPPSSSIPAAVEKRITHPSSCCVCGEKYGMHASSCFFFSRCRYTCFFMYPTCEHKNTLYRQHLPILARFYLAFKFYWC